MRTRQVFKGYKNGVFFDVGSHNGMDINNTLYFEENNKMITSKINTVVNLSSKLLDISNLSIAELFYCTIKTKMVYPQINLNYSLNIIYGAFIVFCKFNSDIPIYGEITNICKNKPDYINKNDTIEEQILQLQKHGVEYNNKMFLELIKIVGSNNIIHINKNNFELNLIEPLQTAIENINDNQIQYMRQIQKIMH